MRELGHSGIFYIVSFQTKAISAKSGISSLIYVKSVYEIHSPIAFKLYIIFFYTEACASLYPLLKLNGSSAFYREKYCNEKVQIVIDNRVG